MLNRRRIMIFVFLIISFIISFEVKADTDYTRICKYKDLNTNEEVFLYWSKNKKQLKSSDGKIITETIMDDSRDFKDGCSKYINHHPYDYDMLTDAAGLTYGYMLTDTAGLEGNVYELKNVVVAGKDVTNAIACEYELENGMKINVRIDSQGKVTINKAAKITNIDEFLKIIDSQRRCPVSLCYDAESGTDKLTFSNDINYKCPSWYVGESNNTQEDRQRKLNLTIGEDLTKEEEIESKIIKTEYNNAISNYSSCLSKVDKAGQKCSSSYNSMNNKCTNGTDDECLSAKVAYKNCIERRYTQSEIDAYCSQERSSFVNAQNQIKSFEERTGKSLGISIETPVAADCGSLLGSDVIDWIKKIFTIIQVAAVIYTIITGALGYAGAVMASDNDAIKKANKKFITRLIIVVILLLLPVLIEFVLGIAGFTNTNPLCE